MSKKYVYLFSEGNANMRELLGGKGANLAEMTNIGMPVPQGFTISTEACTRYYEDGEKIAPEIEAEIFEYLAKMEALVGKKFGDKENPLLVSVRSGARASMPGMMDTILNLGINDDVAATLAAKSGNVRWAYDSYRRFIMMFSDVAMGYDRLKFEAIMDELKEKRGVETDAGLTAEDMQEMVKRFKVLYKELAGEEFPTDPKVQLMAAVRAVFGSWMNDRAIAYRRMNDIPSSWGTAQAALKVAVDMVNEGLCTKEEALLKIDPNSINALLHPRFDEAALKKAKPVATGLAASPGAGCGAVYFTAEDVKKHAKNGPTLLVRSFTSPEDIEGMAAAKGILTATGGRTSHAAVVARGMGACCVAGCGALRIYEDEKYLTIGDIRVNEGEVMSIDGNTGNVYVGAIPTVDATISGDFAVVMGWADSIRKLKVRTNADTPRDAANAVRLGAEGIGLTRTEHMFFDADRIPAMREMILSTDVEHRAAALAKLLPMQRGDFEGIFKAMEGRPVTIRLLDPPLHEFLPTADEDIKALADEMGLTFDYVKGTILSLHENNPMMGFRGCRLPVKYPEIAEMQTRAIIEAAINVKAECGYDIVPEIMIPLTCEFKELKYVSNIVKATAEKVKAEKNSDLKYLVGTMIEIPRAALTADEIAKEAEFFSFGTNDLTQMTFGFSRDDAGSFLPSYYEKQIFDNDPFERIDQIGVGKLVDMAVKLGRATRPDIHLGICGEHGGEPSSVEFCHRVGLDYVSCSPFRVPIARMAAAQAQIKTPRD